jgi:signal peptidase II
VSFPSRFRWLWLTLVVALLDRASKAWFESYTSGSWPREVVHNYIYLVQSRNPGIGFGILSNSASPAIRILLIAGSFLVIAVFAWLLVSGQTGARASAGLALLLGGAAGNLTDRLLHGAITDFLEVWLRFLPFRLFNPWPAFNVADSAITIGAILILLEILFPSRLPSSQNVKSSPGSSPSK